jgi:hypothetical protein
LSEASARGLYEKALATDTAPSPVAVDDAAQWQGGSDRLSLAALEELAIGWMSLAARFEKRDPADTGRPRSDDEVEGRAAAELHEALAAVYDEPLVLDDPGFWRFLTFRHLWHFARWRERKAYDASQDPEKNKPNNFLKYVDGRDLVECVPSRMFIRARIALHDGSYERSWSVPRATDFWRSHIMRVQVGTAPTLAREMIDLQVEQPLATADLRVYARRINRMFSNVVLHQYDGDAARALLLELRPDPSENYYSSLG